MTIHITINPPDPNTPPSHFKRWVEQNILLTHRSMLISTGTEAAHNGLYAIADLATAQTVGEHADAAKRYAASWVALGLCAAQQRYVEWRLRRLA